VGYAAIGFLDDILKVKHKRSLGLRAYQKIIGQVGLAAVIAVWAYKKPLIGSKIAVPFTNAYWDLGAFTFPSSCS
jgi:phospho-N-acetylmuramoyl-pentapeptide-transferase